MTKRIKNNFFKELLYRVYWDIRNERPMKEANRTAMQLKF